MTEFTYTFNDSQIRQVLRANRYFPLWHEDNWVHESSKDPDHSGMSPIEAFKIVLKKQGLL